MNSLNFKGKLIITEKDKEVLDKINRNRNFITDGVVWEAFIVSIRIWLPDGLSDGVIDICFPVGEDNSYGFKDVLEAKIFKDSMGVYRLSSRQSGKDIPKHFVSIIEQNLLIPVSVGMIVPYHGHIYGKGILYKIADLKAKEYRVVLESVEIISPHENEEFVKCKTDESLPKKYNNKKDIIDYKALIIEGENETLEFKSSARLDLKQNRVNKEIQKAILKSIAGFLNSKGGILLIGVEDDGNIIGIESDVATLKKNNHDGYCLFISDLISVYIGKQFFSYLNISFPNIDGICICAVVVKKSEIPAFIIENHISKFYIRTYNSTRELDSKETFEYIPIHFAK